MLYKYMLNMTHVIYKSILKTSSYFFIVHLALTHES